MWRLFYLIVAFDNKKTNEKKCNIKWLFERTISNPEDL